MHIELKRITCIKIINNNNNKVEQKSQESNTALHELCESQNLWIIKHQNFKPQYHLNRSKLHPNRTKVRI